LKKIILDLHESLAGGSGMIPHYILIDKSGNVKKHWYGFSDRIAKEQDEMFADIFMNNN